MIRTTLIVGAAISALIVSACSKPAAKTDATADATPAAAPVRCVNSAAAADAPMTAADFVTKAASTDMFEITEAKMAQKKATSPDVKKFASHDDHRPHQVDRQPQGGDRQVRSDVDPAGGPARRHAVQGRRP